jgi:hypothetical protein
MPGVFCQSKTTRPYQKVKSPLPGHTSRDRQLYISIMKISRHTFLRKAATCAAGMLILPGHSLSSPLQNEKGAPLDPLLVREFVGAAHKDMAKVKTMLVDQPDLLNAVNNLGGWDWEDAVGAAGHVGYTDLAHFLLEKGARLTICVAAMLGKTTVVRSSIESFPFLRDAVGPHRISLYRHAEAGGENGREVLEYLRSIGINK